MTESARQEILRHHTIVKVEEVELYETFVMYKVLPLLQDKYLAVTFTSEPCEFTEEGDVTMVSLFVEAVRLIKLGEEDGD